MLKLKYLLTLMLVFACIPVYAVEPYQEFLTGLRAKGYHDYAIFYLEELESKPNLPKEIKDLIPYEKAMTYLNAASRGGRPQERNKQLDQALIELANFVKSSPRHPKAAEAETERGSILLNKARVEIWQINSPSEAANKAIHQKEARALISQARKIFQAAHDKHKAAYSKFPKFIPDTEKAQKEARQDAEINYIRAQLDLAMCTYEEAQTYDQKDAKRKTLSYEAAKQFDEIHQKYRTQVGGLYAKLWQGKCFEEQEELGKALGIYNSILDNEGKSSTMKQLQEQATHFRLICLNHEQRNDHQLVVQEANDWLSKNRNRRGTPVWLGINWELAKAQEQLGLQRTADEDEKKNQFRQALQTLRSVNQYGGQYQDVSLAAIRRLEIALRGKAGDPEDFDTAFGLGQNMVKEIKGYEDRIQAEKNPQKRKELQVNSQEHLQQTARMLNLALKLADSKTDLNSLNKARYLLAYVYYRQQRSYESAVLGEYIAKRHYKDDAQTAIDSAYLAMAAYMQAFNAESKDRREFEMGKISEMGKFITTHWPDDPKSQDVRMNLGQLYTQHRDPIKAAGWYTEVPKSNPRYGDAQMGAGQAYWSAYLSEAVKDEKAVSADQLKQWQTEAEKHLQIGIEENEKQIPEKGKPTEEWVAAQVSLAQILINKGDNEKALKILKTGTHPVVNSISLAKDQKRPSRGIKSKEFAGLVYQLLLRAYVALQKTDEAIAAMQSLEKVGGSDTTTVFVQLGMELQKQLELLKETDIKRFDAERMGFEAFLENLAKREQGQTFQSLFWIAETYSGLGETMSDMGDGGKSYFAKAANTYDAILKLPPDQLDEQKKQAVRLRVVSSRRRQQNFDGALAMAESLLKQQPKAIQAQFESAYIFQDWGKQDPEKYQIAISGTTKQDPPGLIWGWGQISNLLHRQLDINPDNEQYREKFVEARYNIAHCRYQYGLAQQSTQKREKEFETTRLELESIARLHPDMPEEWYTKYNTLYSNVLREMGLPVTKLERPAAQPETTSGAIATSNSEPVEPAVPVAQTKPNKNKKKAAASGGSSTMYIIIGLVIAGLGTAGFVFIMAKPRRRVRTQYGQRRTMPSGNTAKSPRQPSAKRAKQSKPGAQAVSGKSTKASAAKSKQAVGTSKKATAQKRTVRRKPAGS